MLGTEAHRDGAERVRSNAGYGAGRLSPAVFARVDRRQAEPGRHGEAGKSPPVDAAGDHQRGSELGAVSLRAGRKAQSQREAGADQASRDAQERSGRLAEAATARQKAGWRAEVGAIEEAFAAL